MTADREPTVDDVDDRPPRWLTPAEEAERAELRYANTSENLRKRVLAQLNGNARANMTDAELRRDVQR